MPTFMPMEKIKPKNVPKPDFRASFHSFLLKINSKMIAPKNGPIIMPIMLPTTKPIINPTIAPAIPQFEAPYCFAPINMARLSMSVDASATTKTSTTNQIGKEVKSVAKPEIRYPAKINHPPGKLKNVEIMPAIQRIPATMLSIVDISGVILYYTTFYHNVINE